MTENLVPTNDCSHCGGPVPKRRPSASGKHWCSKPKCRAAKQRYYYANGPSRSAEAVDAAVLEELKLTLVVTLSQAARVTCEGSEGCGRTDALPGWVHPNVTWTDKCLGTGYVGDHPDMTPYFKAVWPEGCPF